MSHDIFHLLLITLTLTPLIFTEKANSHLQRLCGKKENFFFGHSQCLFTSHQNFREADRIKKIIKQFKEREKIASCLTYRKPVSPVCKSAQELRRRKFEFRRSHSNKRELLLYLPYTNYRIRKLLHFFFFFFGIRYTFVISIVFMIFFILKISTKITLRQYCVFKKCRHARTQNLD